MSELLITVFLLLCVENALYVLVFSRGNFMKISDEKSGYMAYSFELALFSGISMYLPACLESEGILLPIIIGVLLAVLLVGYEYFIKKNENWLFFVSLAVNVPVASVMGYCYPPQVFGAASYTTIIAVALGVFVACLGFCGVKDCFERRSKNSSLILYAVSLILVAICVFWGVDTLQ